MVYLKGLVYIHRHYRLTIHPIIHIYITITDRKEFSHAHFMLDNSIMQSIETLCKYVHAIELNMVLYGWVY